MSDPAAGGPPDGATLSISDRLLVWQTLATRRAGLDTLMWQTPALGMTAQAFLMTLALGDSTTRFARLTAASLSLILSLMVIQLMAKHRRHEMLDSLLLADLEQALDLDTHIGTRPHAGPSARQQHHLDSVDARLHRSIPGPKRIWRMSSYELWQAGLAVFAIAAILIIVLAASGADSWLVPGR